MVTNVMGKRFIYDHCLNLSKSENCRLVNCSGDAKLDEQGVLKRRERGLQSEAVRLIRTRCAEPRWISAGQSRETAVGRRSAGDHVSARLPKLGT
jgi:hypothetical protein